MRRIAASTRLRPSSIVRRSLTIDLMKNDKVSPDPYAAIAEFYDLEHEGFVDDHGFYLNVSTLLGGPVLELGCGSGRIMKPLLATGLSVTGLDSSPVMLDRARGGLTSKRERAGLTLFEGEMAGADRAPGGPFGVVIIALNGLLHATTSSEQRSVLQSARSTLRPGGQLLLDVVSPASLLGFDGEVLLEGFWTTADGQRVDKFSSRRVDSALQELNVTLWYDITSPEGSVHRTHSGFTQRYVHRAELELMLELAGFVEWTVYGGYELEPFDEGSERIVIAAER